MGVFKAMRDRRGAIQAAREIATGNPDLTN